MTVSVRTLAERWASGLAAAVAAITGEVPPVSVREGSAPDAGLLWWRQEYSPGDGAVVWAGAAEESWFGLGAAVLAAAGIEITDAVDARNTWFELLCQAGSGVASELGRAIGAEMSAGASAESDPPHGESCTFEVQIGTEGAQRLSWVAFSDALISALQPKTAVGENLPARAGRSDAVAAAGSGDNPKSLDLLLDVELPVSVSFGRAQLPLKDVLKLTTGAIIELNRSINEPVELLVNNSVIARGEVVVIEGNYGIRIQEIVSREHRMRTLR